jgi:hypothetical protein
MENLSINKLTPIFEAIFKNLENKELKNNFIMCRSYSVDIIMKDVVINNLKCENMITTSIDTFIQKYGKCNFCKIPKNIEFKNILMKIVNDNIQKNIEQELEERNKMDLEEKLIENALENFVLDDQQIKMEIILVTVKEERVSNNVILEQDSTNNAYGTVYSTTEIKDNIYTETYRGCVKAILCDFSVLFSNAKDFKNFVQWIDKKNMQESIQYYNDYFLQNKTCKLKIGCANVSLVFVPSWKFDETLNKTKDIERVVRSDESYYKYLEQKDISNNTEYSDTDAFKYIKFFIDMPSHAPFSSHQEKKKYEIHDMCLNTYDTTQNLLLFVTTSETKQGTVTIHEHDYKELYKIKHKIIPVIYRARRIHVSTLFKISPNNRINTMANKAISDMIGNGLIEPFFYTKSNITPFLNKEIDC